MDTIAADRVTREDLLARAEALKPLLRERADETEKDRRVSYDVIEKMRAAEFFRVLQPTKYGGFEHDWPVMVDIQRELASACGSTGWVTGLAMAHQWLIANFSPETQDEVWADDPGAIAFGSYAPATMAEAAEGGYRITGSWSFASGCDNGDWGLLAAMIPDAGPEGGPVPGFFLVPKADYTIDDNWFTMGLVGTGSKNIVCDNTFVPAHRKVTFPQITTGTSPGGLAADNPLYRLPVMACLPVCICIPAIGILQGAIEDFKLAMETRETRGAIVLGGSKVAQFQSVQTAFAEANIALDAAKLQVKRDLDEILAVAAAGEQVSVDLRIRNRMTQAHMVRTASRAIEGLFDASGGKSIFLDNRIQRAWRDINAIARHVSLNWPAVSSMYGQNAFGLEPVGQY